MTNKIEEEIITSWKGHTNKPLVSICCITYNHENYINEALDSFLMQETDFPFEIIVRDDASDDNTAEIIKEYKTKFPNIIKPIYETTNQYTKGVKPMPVTFKKASGKYFALCEGDDCWIDTNKLQKQVDFLENNIDYNICVHDTDIIKEGEIQRKEWRWDSTRTTFTTVDYIYSLFFHTSSIMFRNLKNQRYIHNDQILQGDMAIVLSVINNKKVHFIEEVMSRYRIHLGGITNSTLHVSKLNIYTSLLIMFEKFDVHSNRKFKEVVWLKKQIIKSILYINNTKRFSFAKLLIQGYYYLMKIILKLVVKLFYNEFWSNKK